MSLNTAVFNQTGKTWQPTMLPFETLPKRRTLGSASTFEGVGVHSGDSVRMTIQSAPAHSGITFQYQDTVIKADYRSVQITPMATTLVHSSGLTIHTIEHVMAALYGCGITDAAILLEGCPEVPIMDGSAEPFLSACKNSVEFNSPCSGIAIIQPVEVKKGDAVARFSPSSTRRFSFKYDEKSPFFDYTQGQQTTLDWDEDGHTFQSLIAPARTFGFFEDGQRLQAMGLARGASLDNTVVLHNQSVMNKDGLRAPNEMLHHKILDAVGDIALWGELIYGHFEGINTGHALNNALLHALAQNTEAWVRI